MNSSLVLRGRQSFCIDALRDGFIAGHRSQLLYAPCGFGKTEIAIALLHATAIKDNKSAMVLDRRVLVSQTSERLKKYSVDHGIVMAGEEPNKELIQICSIQTLEKKGTFPGIKLLVVDETHQLRSSVKGFIKNNPQVKVVGVTGTPFTKGLGAIYTNVINGATIKELVSEKALAPLKVFVCKEIDMTGAAKVGGEWSADEVTERGIKISGDIVNCWLKMTMEVFGEAKKTIVNCAGVAHGMDLSKQFAKIGYNFVSISYKDDDQFKADAFLEFSKPISSIHGLIATDILTKGFSQDDILIGISARPFTKSFSSHVQQMGRPMRGCEGKDFALWICHSGNYIRFKDDWDDLYENGVSELDDGKESAPKPEPSEEKKEAAKCPKCGLLWETKGDTCTHCGHTRVRRNEVIAVPGELTELIGAVAKAEKYTPADKARWYSELLGYCQEKGKPVSYALAVFHEKFKSWPHGKNSIEPSPPGREVLGYIRSKNIAYAKGMAARAKS